MLIKFMNQVTMTFLIMQIMNVTLDEFILMGIAKIAQAMSEAEEAEKKSKSKQKLSSISNGLSVLNGRFFTNFSNMTSYTQAGLFILSGLIIHLYLLTLLFKTWRFIFNKNRQMSSFFSLKNFYANIFLLVSIVVNICLIGLFLVLSDRALKDFQKQKKTLQDFRLDLVQMDLFKIKSQNENEFNSWNNGLRVNQSMAKLETYFYVKYINFNIAAFCFDLVKQLLTCVYLTCIS